MVTTNKVKQRVVCDAGPVIHLDELNCIDLLKDFQEILVPYTVWKEITRHRPSVLEKQGIFFTHCALIYPLNEPLYTLCRVFSLDAGEIEALAIMEKNPEAIFITDDASARLAAEQMGFKVHGTIGIIVRSIRKGRRNPEQVLGILEEIPLKSTIYIKYSLLDEIKRKIKTEFHL